ncbi:TPA: hypothetical protein QCR52_004905 [Bacillus cereus]|nr:hypothetical protein [Bacillus cereus]HDR4919715.1 hypothetical protein [Bacillus cereus]
MNPFFLKENLVDLVKPNKPGLPYFRPFILHGKPEQIDLFLIGINPATAVYPEKGISVDTWIETLMDNRYYDAKFSSNGQTRIGIRGFLNYVKRHYPHPLLETNINAFPTPKAKDLKGNLINESVIEGEIRFKKLFLSFEPSLIILHSQHTTKYFIDFLVKNKFISKREVLKKTPIKLREKQFPHFTFSYSSGKVARVFACRHLKLFGYNGKSFEGFINGLTPYLK